jgi:hypothetical protein
MIFKMSLSLLPQLRSLVSAGASAEAVLDAIQKEHSNITAISPIMALYLAAAFGIASDTAFSLYGMKTSDGAWDWERIEREIMQPIRARESLWKDMGDKSFVQEGP